MPSKRSWRSWVRSRRRRQSPTPDVRTDKEISMEEAITPPEPRAPVFMPPSKRPNRTNAAFSSSEKRADEPSAEEPAPLGHEPLAARPSEAAAPAAMSPLHPP